ncbi:STAS domain-containing protein [uncultured Erythrobacter sp.]|uniref:STAS domain-containing protein n=1 Tax=uncultured Erythrobacter sp. TaxID=263913 RepID=UPI00263194DC|nr:STAS domain-containing protein [uncultured Erythrobacter sp.]
MEHLAQIAPILGAYTDTAGPSRSWQSANARGSFGNRVNPRYATGMSGDVLQWSRETRGSAVVLSPQGRVDETSADAFKDHLVDAVEANPPTAIIDLSGIEYMSSRGLRGLTLAQRAANESGTTIVLACPNDTMREILAISRYDMVFRVADTIEDAIGN